MQIVRVLITLTVIALLPLGLTGCKPDKKEAAASATAEQKMKEAEPAAEHPAKEQPAAAKPKDHPAH